MWRCAGRGDIRSLRKRLGNIAKLLPVHNPELEPALLGLLKNGAWSTAELAAVLDADSGVVETTCAGMWQVVSTLNGWRLKVNGR